jgi:hypothetical protein
MSRRERLKIWIETLEIDQIKDLLVECVDELIDAQIINFYTDTKVPYWDGNGERLDGTEYEEED